MRHEDTVVAPMPTFERPVTAGWDEGVTTVRWAQQPTAPPPPYVPSQRPDATPTAVARIPALPSLAQPVARASTAHTPVSTANGSRSIAHTPLAPAHTPLAPAHTPPSTAHTPPSTAHTPLAPAHTPSAPAHMPSAPSASPAPAARSHGKVIVMFACRGGAGATTLTVNTAAALARAGKSVCVLDLDLQLGDVFVALDLEPTTSIAALAREADTIDGPALRRRLARHESGVYALSQTGRLDELDPQLTERMPTLLATLAGHFDVVLVDGVRDFGDHALAALDMADQIALVVTQDVPSVRRAARVTQLFRKLGYSERKIRLVLNRHAARAPIDDAQVQRALALPVAARVRNDFARIRAALDQGALLQDVARGSGVARDVDELATTLAGAAPAAPIAKLGLVRRLFGRKR